MNAAQRKRLWDMVAGLRPPVQDEVHSQQAAANAESSARGVRERVCLRIAAVGPQSCEQLHDVHRDSKHQSVSAACNLLREAGILWTVGDRDNDAGNEEGVNDLSADARAALGLPPGLPRRERQPRTPRSTVRAPWQPAPHDVTEAAWTLVRRENTAVRGSHPRAYAWARAHLDESRRTRP